MREQATEGEAMSAQMSLEFWCWGIRCCKCPARLPAGSANAQSIGDVLKEHGWKVTRKGEIYCREHAR